MNSNSIFFKRNPSSDISKLVMQIIEKLHKEAPEIEKFSLAFESHFNILDIFDKVDYNNSEKGYNLKISFEINQMARSFFESKSYDLTQEISTKDMRQLFVECKRLLANHYNQYVYTLNYGGIIYFGKLLEIRFWKENTLCHKNW